MSSGATERGIFVKGFGTTEFRSEVAGRRAVCGEYCCLFALYKDRGFTPKEFVGLFDAATADRQISRLFTSEFGPLRTKRRRGQG